MSLATASAFATAAWDMDEASGTRADQIGSNDLTDTNTVASAAGMFGNAADFEDTNSEDLRVADHADISSGDADFCVRLWVNLETKPGSSRLIFQKTTGSSSEYGVGYSATQDRFFFRVYGSSGFGDEGAVFANNLGSPSTATWYLIHGWHDATNNQIGIAVNAGTADTASHSAGIFDGTGTLYFGQDGFSAYYDGLIDDAVILKNYILNATERTEDYNGGVGKAFATWALLAGSEMPHALHRYKNLQRLRPAAFAPGIGR